MPQVIKESVPTPAPSKQLDAAASLVIEPPTQEIPGPVPQKKTSELASASAVTPEPRAAFGSLKKIREKIARQDGLGDNGPSPLTDETLKQAWEEYIALLKAKKNHSSVTIFKMAELEVLDDNSFLIHTGNTMQQKFIETERPGLIEHLMNKFNNRTLSYQIQLTAVDKEESTPDKPLTKKEKYQQMIEQYPMVKVLKERIRLELD